jgi:hypothetical protein
MLGKEQNGQGLEYFCSKTNSIPFVRILRGCRTTRGPAASSILKSIICGHFSIAQIHKRRQLDSERQVLPRCRQPLAMLTCRSARALRGISYCSPLYCRALGATNPFVYTQRTLAIPPVRDTYVLDTNRFRTRNLTQIGHAVLSE